MYSAVRLDRPSFIGCQSIPPLRSLPDAGGSCGQRPWLDTLVRGSCRIQSVRPPEGSTLGGPSTLQARELRRLHYRRSLRARRTPRPIRTIPESQFRIRSNRGFSENQAAIALPATATNMLIGTPVT